MIKIKGYELYSVISDYGRRYHYAHKTGNQWWSLCGLGWDKILMTTIAVNCKTCLKKIEQWKGESK